MNYGSMFVWIPRYAYKITNGYHETAGTTGQIDVKFLKGTTSELADESSETIHTSGYDIDGTNTKNAYFLHPAFSSNVDIGGWDTELSGIWVAKFEASSNNPSATDGGGDVTDLEVKVLPNVTSWKSITTGNSYTNCLNMIPSLNSHMMKNSEWGAVAYLSVSKYGKGTGNEITINNNDNFLTGGGNYVSNTGQSTTGNIYGIYDINGGAWERTASYIANGDGNLGTYGKLMTEYTSSTNYITTSSKYVTVYKKGSSDTQELNYGANKNTYGDAVYETSNSYDKNNGSWFSDYSYFPYGGNPFFIRRWELL